MEQDSSLLDQVTIVLTTSPVRTHPSTRLIEETFLSFALTPELSACKKIIVADGVKIKDQSKFRSGMVTTEADAAYRHYLHRLSHLIRTPGSSLHGAALISLQERHGFAHALRRGLMRVTTPYILVAQHDRSFRRTVPMQDVIESMSRDDAINYVGFPTSSTVDYIRLIRDKYAMKISPIPSSVNPDISFVPLVQWYDSMHIAKTEFYKSRIFGMQRFVNLPPGGFIEDTLGQAMLATIKQEGMMAHAQYGMFICSDGNGVAVSHIDGHDSRAATSECRKFEHTGGHTGEEDWQVIEHGHGDLYWVEWDKASNDGELPYEVLSGYNDEIVIITTTGADTAGAHDIDVGR
jgi:hypothetical protein